MHPWWRMATTVVAASTFTHEVVFVQDPIHCPLRAQVAAFIEQRGVHLGRCKITKTFRTQDLADLVTFSIRDPPRNHNVLGGRFRSRRNRCQTALGDLAAMMKRAFRHPERSTRFGNPDTWRPGLDQSSHGVSVFASALLWDISCKSAETFPCVSINSCAV